VETAAATSLARLSDAQPTKDAFAGNRHRFSGWRHVRNRTRSRIGFEAGAHAGWFCNSRPSCPLGPPERTAQRKQIAAGCDRPRMARRALETTQPGTSKWRQPIVFSSGTAQKIEEDREAILQCPLRVMAIPDPLRGGMTLGGCKVAKVAKGQILAPKRLKRLSRGQKCTPSTPDARSREGQENFDAACRRSATNGVPTH